jgi:hypothetical protein
LLRTIASTALFLAAFSSPSYAIGHRGPGDRITCEEVRYYVATYTAPVAENYARTYGASEAQIKRARRCLAKSYRVAR